MNDIQTFANIAGMTAELIENGKLVRVVRCKDCEHLINHYGFMDDGYCANMRDKYGVKFKPDKDWFCDDGEHKSADEILMEEMDADPLE